MLAELLKTSGEGGELGGMSEESPKVAALKDLLKQIQALIGGESSNEGVPGEGMADENKEVAEGEAEAKDIAAQSGPHGVMEEDDPSVALMSFMHGNKEEDMPKKKGSMSGRFSQ